MIKLEIVDRDNKKTDITQLVEKVTWSGDYKQAARKLEFSIISNKYDKKIPIVDIQEGYMVFFYENNKELFRGFIYTIEKTTDTTSYMAYDHAQKLVNIKVNYNFKDMTAKQITEKMLDDYSKYGLKKGSIIDDKVSWSKIFIGVSMYDTIMSAYTNAHANNDKEYMCYAKEGKICTALKGDIKLDIQFKEKENIISTTYKSSIENVVNRVIITDDSGNQIGEEKNSKSIELYGLFQEVIKAESSTTEDIQETTDNDDDNDDNTQGTGNFIWPVPSVHKISSPFGPRKSPTKGASTYHHGIDIPGGGVSGKSIVASDSGKVVVASTGYNGGRGNYVVIDHGNGKGTLYQHLKSYSVKVGQSVKQGDEIAKMGSTGVSTGPHLHFEVHENFSGTKGTPVNPQKYVSLNDSSKASSVSYTYTTTDENETTTTTTTTIDLEGARKEAKKTLKDRERSASLDGYGDTTCITGNGVTVTDSSTGLKGLFYIDTDSHTWENGEYKIQLNLNYKNLMNEVNAGEDEQQTTPIDDNYDSTERRLNGKKVKALFTAYYPANTKREGGFYDSMGNRLDPSKNTCAAPKQIPFKTKIQPLGTGTFIDGKTYTVTDRGGAIEIKNGVYHIDILMSTYKECNTFGVRHGYIIIGDGTGYKDSPPSSNLPLNKKQEKLISVAKSKLGCRYVWGAPSGSETVFDCSSFTQYVYKKALGINLLRTSNDQGEQGKKITSVSNLQAGDLIYFNTYATSRANKITHVGMYIGNGQMIHASYSKKKVIIVDLKPYLAYKGTKFIWARRHI